MSKQALNLQQVADVLSSSGAAAAELQRLADGEVAAGTAVEDVQARVTGRAEDAARTVYAAWRRTHRGWIEQQRREHGARFDSTTEAFLAWCPALVLEIISAFLGGRSAEDAVYEWAFEDGSIGDHDADDSPEPDV